MSGMRGDRELLNRLRQLGDRARPAVGRAIFAEGIAIFAESQTEVPVDTGFLKSGGYITPPHDTPEGLNIEIGYTAPYALEVHENLGWQHQPPTKARYLADPLNRARPGFNSRVMARLRQEFRL